jgi:hypothetical protein
MILGLPLSAWILILFATVTPLALAIRFYLVHRDADRPDIHV